MAIANLEDDVVHRFNATACAVPALIELDAAGENLLWSWQGDIQWRPPAPGMLESFIGLANGTPQRILGYARSYGPLGLCDHGLPATHHPGATAMGRLDTFDLNWPRGCEPAGFVVDGVWTFQEPIAGWRRLAREALAIAVRIASRQDQTGQRRFETTLWLAEQLNTWLKIGHVGPVAQVTVEGGEPFAVAALVPTIGADNLFGHLALRLLFAATGARGLALCSGCGEWFTPVYGQRTGERSWCPRQRCQKAKQAAASADYRQRKRVVG